MTIESVQYSLQGQMMNLPMLRRFAATTIACLIALPVFAESIEDEALAWLQDYIRVDTTNTPLYRAIESVTAERHPGSRIVPSVESGFTDSHFTRDLGIASYGFDPIVVEEHEWSGIHGNDERVRVDAFKRGVSDHLAIIRAVVSNDVFLRGIRVVWQPKTKF